MQLLKQAARSLLGLELTTAQLQQFQLYFEKMVAKNEQVNLTAIVEYQAVQIRHFLDSLTLASAKLRGDPVEKTFEMDAAALVDIGTGAGFPGLPLKIIYPQIKLTLVESVSKKADFLRELVTGLRLTGVTVLSTRAEDLGHQTEHRASYDVAAARAVAALPVLAEYCLPLVKPGGLFIAPKKGALSEEIESARKAITLLGGRLRPTPLFILPEDSGERQLIVIEKVSETPSTYPRKNGTPSKKPLI